MSLLSVATYLQKARLLLEQGRAHDAERQLGLALEQEPENHFALSMLARCRYDLRKFKEGMDIIRNAISLAPQEDYYYYLQAFGHYQLNQNKQALAGLDHAIALNPYVPEYFGLSALISMEEKDFRKALSTADTGLEIDPENITCLNARSTALNKLKRTDDAIETMKDALQQDPENEFTHTTIGWNLLEKGMHRNAMEHFSEALRINPNQGSARAGLKESLKSRIPPYRWLLQYSFWINNKGKQARWIIPVGLYLIVRILIAYTSSGKEDPGIYSGVLVGLYIAFVMTSWIINPLANFFLLFHPVGKHALTNKEKWNAILLITAFAIGLGLLCIGLLQKNGINEMSPTTIAALITLSLSIPLGHMQFPLSLKDNSRLQWYSMALVLAGIAALLLAFADKAVSLPVTMVYGLGFVIYTWLQVFSKK